MFRVETHGMRLRGITYNIWTEEILSTSKGALALAIVLTVAGCGKKETADTIRTETASDSVAMGTTGSTADTGITPPPTPPPAAPGMSDRNIVAKLASADSIQIEASKLALSKSKSADIREFANMMVTEHEKMKSEGAALASRLAIAPEPMPDDPAVAQMAMTMQVLRSAPDNRAFDMAYIDQMVISHQKSLEFLKSASTMTKNDSLRAFIQKGESTVRTHLDRALQLMGKMGAAVSQ